MPSPLEEISYIFVSRDDYEGCLEAIHIPNRFATHENPQVRAAYHFGVCRAAYEAAAREGYEVIG